MRGSPYNRLLQGEEDADPVAGMANLFDVAMVFAIALMVALVTGMGLREIFSEEEFTMVKNPGTERMEIIVKQGEEITRYRPGDPTAAEAPRGRRVGTAYELEDGRVIYVPE